MIKRTLLIVSILLTGLTGGLTEAKEYTIGLVGYANFAPFVIADEKGFFAEEGFDVTLKYYLNEDEWIKAFFNKRHDLSMFWNSAHFGWYAAGLNFVSIGAYSYEEGSFRVIARPEVTPENIVGQKVGATVDVFSLRWFLWDYLKRHNLKMSDISIVTLTSEEDLVKNFLAGRLKVVIVRGTNADNLIAQGDGVVLSSSTPQQTLVSILMHHDTYQASPKPDLKRMYRALIRAIAWLKDPANAQEYFEIVKTRFAETPHYAVIDSLERFNQLQDRVTFIEPQELYTYNTTILKRSYNTMKTVLAEIGTPQEFRFDEIVDTSALLEVLEEMELTDKPATTE
jgi:ABC-type nitrate/sulfonate/bicarbonate transport system substrate-binding protein